MENSLIDFNSHCDTVCSAFIKKFHFSAFLSIIFDKKSLLNLLLKIES